MNNVIVGDTQFPSLKMFHSWCFVPPQEKNTIWSKLKWCLNKAWQMVGSETFQTLKANTIFTLWMCVRRWCKQRVWASNWMWCDLNFVLVRWKLPTDIFIYFLLLPQSQHTMCIQEWCSLPVILCFLQGWIDMIEFYLPLMIIERNLLWDVGMVQIQAVRLLLSGLWGQVLHGQKPVDPLNLLDVCDTKLCLLTPARAYTTIFWFLSVISGHIYSSLFFLNPFAIISIPLPLSWTSLPPSPLVCQRNIPLPLPVPLFSPHPSTNQPLSLLLPLYTHLWLPMHDSTHVLSLWHLFLSLYPPPPVITFVSISISSLPLLAPLPPCSPSFSDVWFMVPALWLRHEYFTRTKYNFSGEKKAGDGGEGGWGKEGVIGVTGDKLMRLTLLGKGRGWHIFLHCTSYNVMFMYQMLVIWRIHATHKTSIRTCHAWLTVQKDYFKSVHPNCNRKQQHHFVQ